MPTMTFTQFQATGRDVADLRTCGDDNIEAAFGLHVDPIPGRLYDDNLYVERLPDGRWNCLIANADMTDVVLENVERFLYDWAVREGYFS